MRMTYLPDAIKEWFRPTQKYLVLMESGVMWERGRNVGKHVVYYYFAETAIKFYVLIIFFSMCIKRLFICLFRWLCSPARAMASSYYEVS
jgi:hypothetical protein